MILNLIMEVIMTNLQKAKKHEDYIISLRRHFHENPELSGKELNTLVKIGEELTAMGIDYYEIPQGGIFATIKGAKDNGKAVLLRGDIDALPVQETDENLSQKRVCKSKVDGVMHACGHDGHTAMLLGAAKMLMEAKDEIEGTIYLYFERGEEGTGNYRYMFRYLDENNIKVDTSYAIHLYADLEAGKMAINDGGMMAGVIGFNITIDGQGGHGSRPDQSINPIDAFVAIYQGMQALRLTKIDPYKQLTYSVGVLNGGSVSNVIPQTVTFGGTVRLYDRDEGKKYREEFIHLVDNICAAYKCRAIYNGISMPSFPVLNDPTCAEFARQTLAKDFGDDSICFAEPWMASESFALYTALFPSVFCFLGVNNPEKGIGAAHHNQAFDLDESVLYKGSAGAVTYALEFLKGDVKPDFTPFEGGFKGYLKELKRVDYLKELYGIEE